MKIVTISQLAHALSIYPRDLPVFIGRKDSTAVYQIKRTTVQKLGNGPEAFCIIFSQKCEAFDFVCLTDQFLYVEDLLTQISIVENADMPVLFVYAYEDIVNFNDILFAIEAVTVPRIGEIMYLAIGKASEAITPNQTKLS